MSDHRHPSFRIYRYNETTNEIIEYYNYRINLNKTIKDNRLVVEQLYNTTQDYNLKKINTVSLFNLANIFRKNLTYFNKYCRYYYDTPLKYKCNKTLIDEIFIKS